VGETGLSPDGRSARPFSHVAKGTGDLLLSEAVPGRGFALLASITIRAIVIGIHLYYAHVISAYPHR
jgi:hypothetical protein